MTLHTINKSPDSGAAFSTCLRLLSPGDALLLLQDAVYAAVGETGPLSRSTLPAGVHLYALQEDLVARGVAGKLMSGCEAVDYTGFVELACLHPKTISWY